MAHSDTLIFLTNISWIFFLFLFSYFFFVLFFLPTFYKKVRARTLIKSEHQRVVLILLVNSIIGSVLYTSELVKTYFFGLLKLVNTLTTLFSSTLIGFNVNSARSFLDTSGVSTINFGGFYIGERRFVGYAAKLNK